MFSSWSLISRDSGTKVVDSLTIADGFWSRMRGVLFGRWQPGSGLLLVPCASVHTFLTRFPIDVVMLDRQGRVLDVRRNVGPWRVVPPVEDTYAVLELPAGSASVGVGTTLRLQTTDADSRLPPKSAMFLWRPC